MMSTFMLHELDYMEEEDEEKLVGAERREHRHLVKGRQVERRTPAEEVRGAFEAESGEQHEHGDETEKEVGHKKTEAESETVQMEEEERRRGGGRTCVGGDRERLSRPC